MTAELCAARSFSRLCIGAHMVEGVWKVMESENDS